MKKVVLSLVVLVLWGLFFDNCFASNDIKVVAKRHDARLDYSTIEDGKLLVSVTDTEGKPIRGLGADDFVVGRGIQKARIISTNPLENVKDIPLNIVLVVDNSFSMKERQAIKPLLSALDEFFKTVRPIDNIHLVVFDDHPATSVNNIGLHAKTFSSSNRSTLGQFLNQAYGKDLTGKTYLYEAMAAGIDIIGRMPEKDHKFLVVFSDGEDLNSDIPASMLESLASGLKNFEAFCVDYMPGSKTDRFLESFAETHGGRIWKAISASELRPIFQAFTTTMLYRYLITYKILDPITVEPNELDFDILTMVDGSPVKNYLFFETGRHDIPEKYIVFEDRSQATSFDKASLSNSMEKYLNILNLIGQDLVHKPSARIKIIGCNSDVGLEKNHLELSRQRAIAVKSYLNKIWQINDSRMSVEARNLPQNATPAELVGAKPENQRVEIVYDTVEMQSGVGNGFVLETNGTTEIHINTNIFIEAGFSAWQLNIAGDDRPIKTLTGKDDIKPLYRFSLRELDMARLPTFNTLLVNARLTDANGKTHETSNVSLPITVTRKNWVDELVRPPHGSITLEPKTLTIEELTTIDSSPFLNYIYFDEDRSDIPGKYVVLKNQTETKSFDERKLKDTMEKHYNVLNIIGQRMLGHPDTRIRIVGCNSNQGAERGKMDLSRSRAEAVKAYLRYIWGIDPSRMDIEARNLPAVASTGSLSEGRAENQRVEIYSDSPALLDVVKSTYVQAICDAEWFRILPEIQAGYQIARWSIVLSGDGGVIGSLEGEGDLEPVYALELKEIDLQSLSSSKTVAAGIEVADRKGGTLAAAAESSVRLIRREERLAQKEGYRVLEKYALILFDFNSSDIKEHNKEIVDRIVSRIKEIPSATVHIVGHTDTIGNEEYNLALSKKRAKAAYDQILAGGVPAGENISYEGIGPHDPLFDNDLPEGRALNRTVTVTLEYELKE
jgi:outer membrane protein OmpA-like peptidoglycan-associated protein